MKLSAKKENCRQKSSPTNNNFSRLQNPKKKMRTTIETSQDFQMLMKKVPRKMENLKMIRNRKNNSNKNKKWSLTQTTISKRLRSRTN